MGGDYGRGDRTGSSDSDKTGSSISSVEIDLGEREEMEEEMTMDRFAEEEHHHRPSAVHTASLKKVDTDMLSPHHGVHRAQAGSTVELAESFFGIEGRNRQKMQRKHRADTIEDEFDVTEPFILNFLNPYHARWHIAVARIVLILIVYSIALTITFGGVVDEISFGVGLAAVLAPVLARIGLFISERLVFNTDFINKSKGQWPMVDWMSFRFFMDAIYNTVKGGMYGHKNGDPRDTNLIRMNAKIHDERTGAKFENGKFYFDFVADTGDGFDPTYTVANLLGKRSLTVTERRDDGSEEDVVLPRGRVLVHGGDLCYPFTTFDNLHYRLIQPYSWAFPKEASRGETLYFAAGNHEYLDGLKGFTDFILARKRIGGWSLPQKSSYFAISLPMGWIMFVLDIGKEPEDIDEYQQNYFNKIISTLTEDDKIILVYHVPDWIKCGAMDFTNMKRLREWRRDLGEKVRLVLTGDLHYYKRMEEVTDDHGDVVRITSGSSLETNCFETNKKQYIIAGNGGAFNHATHYPLVERTRLVGEEDGKQLETKCEFPTPEASQETWRKKWPFMFVTTTNHIYSRVLGGLYLVTFLAVYPQIYIQDGLNANDLLYTAATSVFFYMTMAWYLVTHFIMVTANFEINSMGKFFVSTFLIVSHSLAHFALSFGFRYLIDFVLLKMLGNPLTYSFARTCGYCFMANLTIFLLGTMLSPVVSTLYFYISVHVFNWHYNEAISMIQITEFKGFVRIAIDEKTGDLDLYSIVTDSSPNDWNEVEEPTNDEPALLQSESLEYYLLEKVTMTKFE